MAKTTLVTILGVTMMLIVVAGCAQLLPPGWNATGETPTGAIATEPPAAEDLTVLDEEPAPAPAAFAAPADDKLPHKAVVEGELVSFPNLQATDPDGDLIAYTFTPPLDAQGNWQTKVGDAGEYRVTITASDGKNSVSQVVVIDVNPKNSPPTIQLASKELHVKEGDAIALNAQVTDPDGDEVTLTFEGWMTGPERVTTYDDAGRHTVEIIASDGTATASETATVTVDNVNRAPVLGPIADIIIKEGDKITVNPTSSDADGDKVTYLYSAPINPDGTWQTTTSDVGKYRVNVTATDSQLSAMTSFLVVVESLNHAPVIQVADLITLEEGQAVTLSPVITDAEGDELAISYGGWMQSNTYTTTYEDSGSHLVTITATDGINTAKKDVTVMVTDVNRAPTFGGNAFS